MVYALINSRIFCTQGRSGSGKRSGQSRTLVWHLSFSTTKTGKLQGKKAVINEKPPCPEDHQSPGRGVFLYETADLEPPAVACQEH